MPSNFKVLSGASGEPNDPNFKNVTLLLHGDGSNGAQNNTFLDSSTNNFTITRNGNATQGSFSPYGSNWSNYFDGSGDYLTAPDNAALQLGSSNFTIEFWVNFTTVPGAGNGATLVSKFDTSNTGYEIILYNNTMYFQAQTASIGMTYAWTPTAGTWYHIAWTRSGANSYGFINGALVVSTSSASGSITNLAQALQIGRRGDNSFYLTGYMSNVRVVKGTAVYTAAFTPSMTPLTAITNTSLLTCQSNRLIDNSANNFTITKNGDVRVTNFAPFAPSSSYSTSANGGSGYFDGSGDYLYAPNNTALNVWDSGSGNFTVEAWIYPTVSVPNNCTIVGKAELNGDPGWTAGWAFQAYNSKLNVNTAGDTRLFNSNATDIPVGAWSHVVLVKSSSTVSIFQNGVRVATITNSNSYSNTTDQVHIGTDRSVAGSKFTGWMAGIRMVKGTAVYDPTQSTLTVPTTPPTAVTNTNLLLNATNGAIFDNSMKNDLETVGNAQISTSVKKFGTGSMAFDGSGDGLKFPSNSPMSMGTGNFTWEFWVNPATASAGYKSIIDTRTATLSDGFFFGLNLGTLQLVVISNVTVLTASTSLTANTWQHVALVRSSGTLTIYLGGTSIGSVSNSTNLTSGAGVIGASDSISNPNPFNGYIDDLRVTAGLARYTANFTAPTAPFPNK
jgi:hypothetical protein